MRLNSSVRPRHLLVASSRPFSNIRVEQRRESNNLRATSMQINTRRVSLLLCFYWISVEFLLNFCWVSIHFLLSFLVEFLMSFCWLLTRCALRIARLIWQRPHPLCLHTRLYFERREYRACAFRAASALARSRDAGGRVRYAISGRRLGWRTGLSSTKNQKNKLNVTREKKKPGTDDRGIAARCITRNANPSYTGSIACSALRAHSLSVILFFVCVCASVFARSRIYSL